MKIGTWKSLEEQVLCASCHLHGGPRSPHPCSILPGEDLKLLPGNSAFPALSWGHGGSLSFSKTSCQTEGEVRARPTSWRAGGSLNPGMVGQGGASKQSPSLRIYQKERSVYIPTR